MQKTDELFDRVLETQKKKLNETIENLVRDHLINTLLDYITVEKHADVHFTPYVIDDICNKVDKFMKKEITNENR